MKFTFIVFVILRHTWGYKKYSFFVFFILKHFMKFKDFLKTSSIVFVIFDSSTSVWRLLSNMLCIVSFVSVIQHCFKSFYVALQSFKSVLKLILSHLCFNFSKEKFTHISHLKLLSYLNIRLDFVLVKHCLWQIQYG